MEQVLINRYVCINAKRVIIFEWFNQSTKYIQIFLTHPPPSQWDLFNVRRPCSIYLNRWILDYFLLTVKNTNKKETNIVYCLRWICFLSKHSSHCQINFPHHLTKNIEYKIWNNNIYKTNISLLSGLSKNIIH